MAAALGAGAAWWAIPQLPPEWRPAVDAEPSPPVAIDPASLREMVREAVAELPPPAAEPSGDAEEIQSSLAALDQRMAELGTQVEELRNAPAAEPSGPPAELTDAIAQLRSSVDQQAQEIEALRSQPAPRPEIDPQQIDQAVADRTAQLEEQLQSTVTQTQEQLQAAQEEAQRLQSEAETAGLRARGAAAVALLQSSLTTGTGREAAIADLQAAGVQVPETFSQDLPTLTELRSSFDPAARDALAASLRAESENQGTMGRLGNFLRVQTGARSVEAREGDDPDAILSRAAEKVQAGDIGAALTEIGNLPQPGQEAMAGWTGQAQAWMDAGAAVTQLGNELK